MDPKAGAPSPKRTTREKDGRPGDAAAQRLQSEPRGGGEQATGEKVSQKRQRMELLTQIKYTLVYDERVDREPVQAMLDAYEARLASERAAAREIRASSEATGQEDDDPMGRASAAREMSDDQLFRECAEEEKLDEQAAKKEEIEAAEDEEAGIMP